jgi:chemotaxis protein histidine kinase CheA
LNGEAEVFSRPGQGTRICVKLPMHSVEDPRAQS